MTTGLLMALWAAWVRAEPGFWPYTNPPVAKINKEYGVTLSPGLLDHLMRSAARFDSGAGSGAFVTVDGLFLTNWHLGKGFVRRMPGGERYMKEGYYAPTLGEEIRLPDQVPGGGVAIRIRTVEAIEDVTSKVLAGPSPEGREPIIAGLEKAATGPGRRGQVVKLHGGAVYQLYRYHIYDDIRLVFIPEQAIGGFRALSDDFQESAEREDQYPLDVCLFRVYENGRPAKLESYLRLALEPVKSGDLVFGSGDPGFTFRHNAVSSFLFERDVKHPLEADMLRRRQVRYQDIIESRPLTSTALKEGLENLTKLRRWSEYELNDLNNPDRLETARANEVLLRGSTQGQKSLGQIEAARATMRTLFLRYFLLVDSLGFDSDLMPLAVSMTRLEAERGTPAGEARLKRLEAFSTLLDPEVEQANLMAWMDMLLDRLGSEDPLVKAVLAGQPPRDRAREMAASSLLDPAKRKAMLSPGAVTVSSDSLLAVGRAINAEAAAVRDAYEAQEKIVSSAQDDLLRLRYELLGPANAWPEATNTTRFSYGTVSGPFQGGGHAPATTAFGDLYRYVDMIQRPDLVPRRWAEARGKLNLETQLGFAATIDSVGGNSGTPIVNRQGRLVGVLNSGNMSLYTASGIRDARHDRAGIVAVPALIEALRKIYGADALADELVKGHR
jgi:hypothetical protein